MNDAVNLVLTAYVLYMNWLYIVTTAVYSE